VTNLVDWVGRWRHPFFARCQVPRDLASVTDRGDEAPPSDAGTTRDAIERLWERVETLYRSGVHPAIQVCIRSRGVVALDRSIGYARGGEPGAPADGPKTALTTRTPINLFSAAKAVTAMVVHKLDEQRKLHLDDRICEYIPEFARHGKERITIRHVVAHRAGIPNLPPEAVDLDLLRDPERVVETLCEMRPRTRPGRLLAYHAVTGGFLLAEVVRRATGRSIRDCLESEVRKPLGVDWLHMGVAPDQTELVAHNAVTGPPIPPPISTLLTNALGMTLEHAVELSNDPRFLSGVIPSANLISTARDSSAFFQCLLDLGEYEGRRIFQRRTVHHAIDEQAAWEIDLTLGMPISYGLGFMLGSSGLSLYGWNHPRAFGHLGLSNVFCWADPDRDLAVSLLTTGKPVLSLHVLRMAQVQTAIHETFPEHGRGAGEPAASPFR